MPLFPAGDQASFAPADALPPRSASAFLSFQAPGVGVRSPKVSKGSALRQGDHTPLEPAAVELRSPEAGAHEPPPLPPAGVQTPVAFVPFGEDDPR
ncbi:hypothetical protein, partial [Streptomyces griseorubiginosus]|uniref:hypothetical protein n=1 Tax=Streptomyces griseorubiginosus TaxID=67304 RepID=UPI003F768A0C